MKNLKKYLFATLMCISAIAFNSTYAQGTVSTEDFEILNNTSWEGTLTYLDYQTSELVPIATTMQMKITNNLFEQNVQYTWEPHKNILSKTKIRKKGRFLGKQKVIEKFMRDDGILQIVTSYTGKDDNKKATFYVTYEFNENSYKVKKEVQFEDSDERFMRNSYSYVRIK
ncbi:MAG: hypothetical protein R2795_05780 [Saprospiraceae bacterium]